LAVAKRKQNLTDRTLKALMRHPAPLRKRYMVWDTARSNFGVRVSDKGSLTFLVMTRLDNKLMRWPIGRYPTTSLEAARKRAVEFVSDIEQGIDPKAKQEQARRAAARKRQDTFTAVTDSATSEVATPCSSGSCTNRPALTVIHPRESWGPWPFTGVNSINLNKS
jgi:hypothetical protein